MVDEMQQQLVIVDQNDSILGYDNKWNCHQNGILHRAFSIFLFNDQNELLIQRRSLKKYHSAGHWANSCCGHPLKGEPVLHSANRRLYEELGISSALTQIFSFVYYVELENGMKEHELDNVFVGRYDGELHPDPDEIMETKWVPFEQVKSMVEAQPDAYAYWFKECILNHFNEFVGSGKLAA